MLQGIACTQSEWIKNEGSFFSPKHLYKQASYGLIPWLMRKGKKTEKAMLAKENRPETKYVDGAKTIVRIIQGSPDKTLQKNPELYHVSATAHRRRLLG